MKERKERKTCVKVNLSHLPDFNVCLVFTFDSIHVHTFVFYLYAFECVVDCERLRLRLTSSKDGERVSG